ncbi:spore maturation protein CgeB [Rhodoblastus acidophilus]|uniref:CgeB family protein n=1 Tax=Rhodoblastus acidophilus TaxID=1074 RepID=UPI002224ACCC|nr:glycosyltransferase [Rhodoblastus acidophilus]MCW2285347.1 spore maturation protein CgeB [Rhodoblastus acidophilus]MCW2334303.1 spore maturation protein CgeB [Rhodoblastus acidophilus]
MKIVYFTHSLLSCWNHGNAHFLRGVLRELALAGHDVRPMEPESSWSLGHLLAEHGEAGLAPFRAAYPDLRPTRWSSPAQVRAAVDDADLVLVHEWNEPQLVSALGRMRMRGAPFTLLFHDTHHRAVSDPQAIRAFDLSGYDGVLAFGAALAEIYEKNGWKERAFIWHEAADTRLFRPPDHDVARSGLVWIGNWGDGERSAEIEDFLLKPAARAGLPLDIYGVRYPDAALATLRKYGAIWRGWLANASAPEIFARHLATIHVPRRYYTSVLPGIPTIRVFEALACGIPLVSAPWSDSEGLFRPGDFLVARDTDECAAHLARLRDDAGLRAELAARGLETIRARHSCAHRAAELLAIAKNLSNREAAA